MEHIKETLQGIIKDIGAKKGSDAADVFRLFVNNLTRAKRKHVKCASLRSRVLTVNVDSSVWLYQLNLEKEKLLKKLGLKDIRFRIGAVK